MAAAADSSDVLIRRVRPSDRDELAAFYAALSPESRRARFLGTSAGLSASQSRSFCTPDHQHAEGFVALAPAATGAATVVGHLCLEPVGEGRLELAVAVVDTWQGHGIGRTLFEAALDWARQRRCTEIVASAYADNGRVLRLLSSAPHSPRISVADAGVVNVSIPLVGELPAAWQKVPGRRSPAPARGRAANSRCRVFWRRTRRPAPDAAG
jgi:GNAT superfamily N-acetyltransferase